jgi:tyrosyl-tRNA synthetase
LQEHQVTENPIWIIKLLQDCGAAASGSEARRLVAQGAVKLDGERVPNDKFQATLRDGMILQSGKKFFRRLRTG